MILLTYVTFMIYVMFGDVILSVYIYLSTQVAFYFWYYEIVFLESTTIWGSGFLCGTSQPNLDPKYP